MNQPSALRLALSSWHVKFGLFFLVFGLIFIGVAVHFGADELHFLQRVQAAPATIIGKPIRHAGEGGSADTHYLKKYRYVTATGKTIEKVVEVPVNEWEQTKIGSPLRVWYDPIHPDRGRFGPHGEWTPVWMFGLFGIVFGTVGAVWMMGRVRWIRLAKRLVSEGVLVQGTVTRVADTNSRIRTGLGAWDWVEMYRVEYTFTDSGGQRREGRSNLMAAASARRWHHGNTGPVRFDPADPSRNIWVSEWTAFQNPKNGNV
jgi:hypothetical protein